jgi:GH43 family beta-xylosidase
MYASHRKHEGLNIAPMSDPTSVSGPGVTFVRGTHEWERGWNDTSGTWAKGSSYWIEAPQMLLHEDRVFVVYSAGHTFAEYRLGLLELTGPDPMDPASWTKFPEPVFEPYAGEAGKVFVPGHCCFTRSPDGTEDWIVYHGKDDLSDEKRTARIQKFTWNKDGTPHFGSPIPSGVPQARPSGEP